MFFRLGTPLHFNPSIEVLQILISNGADINAKNFLGYTSLHTAAKLCNHEMAALLLQQDIDINQRHKPQNSDEYATTPLHLAASCWSTQEQKYQTIKVLLENGADVDEVNSNGEIALHRAVTEVKKNNDLDTTNNILTLLLEYGSDINAIDNKGQSILFKVKDVNTAKFLIKRGADVNHRDHLGNSLIHEGVLIDNEEIIDFWIENGVDINVENFENETALSLVFSPLMVNEKMAVFLLNLGAVPNVLDEEGNTLLHKAVFENWLNCAEILIEKGIDIHHGNNQGETPFEMVQYNFERFGSEYREMLKLFKTIDSE